jgi:hypothetical protein
MYPTHASIDGEAHAIASISPSDPGDRHSHRVRFACGMIFDLRGEEEFELHAVGSKGGDQRWASLVKGAATCEHCAAHERGEREAVPTPPRAARVRLADIPTGLACPIAGCGSEIRIRRYGEGAACVDRGHEYTFPEVQWVAASLMKRLATGELFEKKD